MNLSHPSHFAAALRGRLPRPPEGHIRRLQSQIVRQLDWHKQQSVGRDSCKVSELEMLYVVKGEK